MLERLYDHDRGITLWCRALMGRLFVCGVMNLLWVAVLAGFIHLEKAVARGPWLSRLALVGWGLYALRAGLAS
ncbi:MAG: DUF2182 domain-containing protein [Candidatus Methylomirabilales bacterium]